MQPKQKGPILSITKWKNKSEIETKTAKCVSQVRLACKALVNFYIASDM